MAITSPTAPMPRGSQAGLRLPGWLAVVIAGALVIVAGGMGALLVTQVTDRTVNLQLPGQPVAAAPNLLTVQGVGRVAAAPDTMLADLGVEVQRPSVDEALTAARTASDKLTAALQSAGVQPADMQTTGLWVNPRMDYGAQQVTGYTASTTLHVRVRDLGKSNTILTAAANAVGNDIRFSGIQLTRSDLSAQLAQARQAAINAATSQAGEWAKLSNRQLGKISGIQEDYAGYGPDSVAKGGGLGGAGASVPQIQFGQGETVVIVTVSYALN